MHSASDLAGKRTSTEVFVLERSQPCDEADEEELTLLNLVMSAGVVVEEVVFENIGFVVEVLYVVRIVIDVKVVPKGIYRDEPNEQSESVK